MDDHPSPEEQNSAYGPTWSLAFTILAGRERDMRGSKFDQLPAAESRYPGQWREAADLRVFRARPGEWHKLSSWRREMTRLGWRLLKVDTTDEELVAVFGKTRLRNR